MLLMQDWIWHLVLVMLAIVAILVPVLVCVAYLTYAERKVMAAMQLRRGPNIVGPFGLLQPLADGAKLFLKETIVPAGANRFIFVIAPMITFVLAMVGWAVIPFGESDAGVWALADINVGILYLFAVSSLGVYGIIMAGWASNSKYAFLGALRSAAQMVSYEVSIGFVLVAVLVCVGSLNLFRRGSRSGRRILVVVHRAPVSALRDLLHLGTCGDEPGSVRSAGGRVGARLRLQCRILGDDIRPVLPRRIRKHDPVVGARNHPFPGRLAASSRDRAARLDPGSGLVSRQDVPAPLSLPLGEGDVSALPV